MNLDIRTTVVVAAFMATFSALAMLFYRCTRKTYPGFGLWTLSLVFLAAGYLLISLRGAISDYLSIQAGNAAILVAAVIGLSGTKRFLGGRAATWAWYLLPATMAIAVIVLDAQPRGRNMALSVGLVLPLAAMAVEFWRYKTEDSRLLYRVTGGLLFFWSTLISVRAFLVIPQIQYNLFDHSQVHSYYFFLAMVSQTAWTAAVIMLTNQRLEQELRDARAEVKTLSGLLPICAHCKKIRDDKGYWQQLEAYLSSHSQARFTHGICPECARTLYPDIYAKMKKRGAT